LLRRGDRFRGEVLCSVGFAQLETSMTLVSGCGPDSDPPRMLAAKVRSRCESITFDAAQVLRASGKPPSSFRTHQLKATSARKRSTSKSTKLRTFAETCRPSLCRTWIGKGGGS